MYRVTLNKGTSYYDPKTSTHLKQTKKSRTFNDKELKNFDMSNIEYAVSVNVLKKTELEEAKEVKEEETNEAVNIETDEVKQEETDETPLEEEKKEEKDLEEFTDEGEPRCQEITGSGSQCKNQAKYPEEEPRFCGTHKDKHKE